MKTPLVTLCALVLATTSAHGALFAQGNHVNRGLVHRHRSHGNQAAPTATDVGLVARAGAAYNETDHDSSASIEIGGQQRSTVLVEEPSSSSSSSVASSVFSTSSVLSTTAATSTLVVPTSVTSSVVSSSSSSVIPSVTSTSTSLQTASSTSSSSTVISSTSSSEIASTEPSSSSSSTPPPTTSTSSTTQLVSTVRSTVTDSAEEIPPTGGISTRAARTAAVSTKIASVSSTASAAAAGAEGKTTGMSGGTKTAIIVVCVVGGIALGALALWTIIRRWKLRPTKRFDGRMRPLDFSPTTPDAFYEKTQRRHSGNSTSSADRQRMQFVDELDQEQYALPHHAEQYDLPPAAGAYVAGVPSHDFTAGVASSYPHQQGAYDPDEQDDYAQLHRGGSLNRGGMTTTFAGVGAGGAGLPIVASHNSYTAQQMVEPYRDDGSYHRHSGGASPPQQGLMREPSLGRPTRGEGPYAAATHFAGSGPRY